MTQKFGGCSQTFTCTDCCACICACACWETFPGADIRLQEDGVGNVMFRAYSRDYCRSASHTASSAKVLTASGESSMSFVMIALSVLFFLFLWQWICKPCCKRQLGFWTK